jgi:hypothetical protein
MQHPEVRTHCPRAWFPSLEEMNKKKRQLGNPSLEGDEPNGS